MVDEALRAGEDRVVVRRNGDWFAIDGGRAPDESVGGCVHNQVVGAAPLALCRNGERAHFVKGPRVDEISDVFTGGALPLGATLVDGGGTRFVAGKSSTLAEAGEISTLDRSILRSGIGLVGGNGAGGQSEKHLVFLDGVTNGDIDAGDGSVNLGDNRVFHLHRFKDHHLASRAHGITGSRIDGDHGSDERRATLHRCGPHGPSLADVRLMVERGGGVKMPRLRQVPRAQADPKVLPMYDLLFGDRDPVAEPGTATGTPGDWWTVFALDPEIFDHAVRGFALYRNPARRLDPKLRELGQTRVGWARASQFVFSQHCKSCREVGIDEEKIAAIPHWQTATCFSAIERAVLAYTDALVYDGGRVADGVFEALKADLSDEEILEFTYITAMYDMHAVMSRALRTEFDDRDDPIVEVDGPDGPRTKLRVR